MSGKRVLPMWTQIRRIWKQVFVREARLSKEDWESLLSKLSMGEVPDGEIGSAIVRLSKPLDRQRIEAAKPLILSYLNHHNEWARHEAMWFIRWSGLLEEKPALIRALTNDPDPDNRGFAALCIANMLRGTGDKEAVDALKAKIQDGSEDSLVREHAYGALIEVVTNRSGSDFFVGKKNLDNVDWDWVTKLP